MADLPNRLRLPFLQRDELRSHKELVIADYSETQEKERQGRRREHIELELVFLTENELKMLLRAAQEQLKVIWLRFKNGDAISGYIQIEMGKDTLYITSICDTIKTAVSYEDIVSVTCCA